MGASDLAETQRTGDAIDHGRLDAGRDPGRDGRRSHGNAGKLSLREREVLNGPLEGRTYKTIAGTLGISPRTVEVHRANAGVLRILLCPPL